MGGVTFVQVTPDCIRKQLSMSQRGQTAGSLISHRARLLPGSVKRNKPFLPQVVVIVVYHATYHRMQLDAY